MSPDPYQTLGVSRRASDEEIHKAYRRLVKLHHPDHNAGSEESERRFEEVQAAYTRIRELRIGAAQRADRDPPARAPDDPHLDDQLADMERQVKQAQAAREQALRDAREAAADALGRRPTDEELGYVTTNDSFGQVLADARDQFLDRLDSVRGHPESKRAADRAADLLEQIGEVLRGERRRPPE
jgi:hypothetical protein